MFSKLFRLLGLFAATALIGCSTVNPYYDVNKKHHTPQGFKNNYGAVGGKPLSQLLKWQFGSIGLPKPSSQLVKGYDFPLVKPDLAFLKANSGAGFKQVTATWISHATVLLQINGLNIITDPHFSERTFFLQWIGPKRKVPLPVQLEELPRIDVVMISHNHYDHLDEGTTQRLLKQAGGEPIFVAPLGVDLWLKEQGAQKVERFDWWDQKDLLGVKLHFVPAQHWSSRSPWDRNATLWGGWVVQHAGKSLYFAGDTGYSQDFRDIGKKFGGFDLSLLPVGAYEPRWFMSDQHVNPQEAAQIHLDIASKLSIGIHWGTFELTDESLEQPLIDLPIALKKLNIPERQFLMLKHGETIKLAP